jgi:hypothetical protein
MIFNGQLQVRLKSVFLWAGVMAQVAQHLPSKCETLISNSKYHQKGEKGIYFLNLKNLLFYF